jgi:uncharacterized protein YegJ (DUF2314 family)
VEVGSIDGGTIRGNLSNEPDIVKKMKLHDAVTVTRENVTDWIYSDGERMVGGFQVKVLAQIEREAATRPTQRTGQP